MPQEENEAVKKVLELSGFSELNPPQRLALEAGLLKEKSMIIASPTASGKTVIAEIAALNVIKNNKKVIYIVPLRALASEKYEEFKTKYEKLGIRVAISIGDLDKSDPWLAHFDFIIVTSEKLDSLLRHGIPWIEQVGLVVADEIHLLNDPSRGPTLEVILTRIRQVANPIFLGLSATINNYKELANWLGAEPIKSDYRPVKLYTGICFDEKIDFLPKKQIKLNSLEASKEIIDIVLRNKKQALIFVNTRRGSESAAEKIGKLIANKLNPKNKKNLFEVSKKAENALDKKTKQCSRLAECIRNGVAFHHAGLVNKQRKLIEDNFRNGLIKFVTATPTLAYGLNLPAWMVVIRDLKRFDSFRGMDYIPILDIQQMMGRCGRPRFDSEGLAVLLPKGKAEAIYAWDNYILGEPEKITSKLGVEPVLRMHVLGLIASEVTPTKKDLFEFFSKTFYAHQYQELSELKNKLENVLNLLQDFHFIVIGNNKKQEDFSPASNLTEDVELKPTRIGKRVAELYIDPLTANHIIKSLEIVSKRGTTDFGLLHIITNCLEMKPLLSLRKKDFENINEIIAKEEHNLIQKPPNPWDLEYDDFLRSIKTAAMLKNWVEEAGEDRLFDSFGITPGELRVRLDNADWLLYSTQELGLLLSYMNILKDIKKVRLRVKYGIREELLPLIRLKGVGRVRARKLWGSNIKSIDKLRKTPIESLSRIIGPKTANEIKEQLG